MTDARERRGMVVETTAGLPPVCAGFGYSNRFWLLKHLTDGAVGSPP
ncbi:hypothetical protein [Actinosynnema sp. NPDC020468]